MTKWTDPLEGVVAKIGEQAQVYAILHRKAEAYYGWWNNLLSIPAIVLATVSGTGSFAIQGKDAATITGILSLVVGLIQTLIAYFRFGPTAETHRLLGISYNKMFNTISTEMALERTEREDADTFLDHLRSEIERLEEVAPNIPPYVVGVFRKDYAKYEDVRRPTIANGLERIIPNTASTVVDIPVPPPEPTIAMVVEPVEKPKQKPWKG
jgi:hypothetical protein